MKESFDRILKPSAYRKFLPYLALVVLLALSILAWQFYEKAMLERERLRYNENINFVVDDITDKLHQYEMILNSGAGIFAASEEVTREEWRVFSEYQQISNHFPSIQRLTISRVVQPSEMTKHVEGIRAEGFPDYEVWPEGEREVYTPVIYMEPFDEHSWRVFGYDVFSDPVRRAAMERARDTGEVSMTSMVTLVTEKDQVNQPGFVMFVPIYNQGMPLNTTEERRLAIKGYGANVFRMHDLIESIFPVPIAIIGFQIYDGIEVTPETQLYDSYVYPDEPVTELDPMFANHKILNLYGHQWTIAFHSMPAFEAAVDRYTPRGILATGLLVSFMVFLYLRMLETTGERALILAQEMTSALRESEEKYRFLTENITDVIWTTDMEGNFTYISPAIEKLVGYMPEEILAMPLNEYIVQKDYDAIMEKLTEELSKPLQERGSSVIMAVRHKTKDNHYVNVEFNTSWLLDKKGSVVGIQGSTRDITERKKLEEKINKSRQMYQSVVDTQQEMVCRYRSDTTLTFVNDAYCRFYGKPARELLGYKFLEFTPPELHDEIVELIKNLTPDQPSVKHEHHVICSDGSVRWQEWTERAIINESGVISEFQGVGHDITERKRAKEELLQAYDATIEGWAYALDLKDEETEGHSKRVTELTVAIARKMNISGEELVQIKRGALLHDMGKMGIPDVILLKPDKLTAEEWIVMREHPRYAYNMLSPIDYLRPALDIPVNHHEKWDGSGYPQGLKGEQIPLPARIFAVVDVFDALISNRPYRKAWSKDEALDHIRQESGNHFDPKVVDLFLQEIDHLI